MNYREWEHEVNELMIKDHGVGVDDIPDMPYRDWFEGLITPKEAVAFAIAIVNEGGF